MILTSQMLDWMRSFTRCIRTANMRQSWLARTYSYMTTSLDVGMRGELEASNVNFPTYLMRRQNE
jgi:hypothetical protein